MSTMIRKTSKQSEWEKYYIDVKNDFDELNEMYPFSWLTIAPTVYNSLAFIRVIAANKNLITRCLAQEQDFLGEYSKELYIEVPLDYQKSGCKVYGAKWVDIKRFEHKDIHFYNHLKIENQGYELCVGIPESFSMMKNVILESVKTAENMLIAYERVMVGETSKLELLAYEHGEKGHKQFRNDKAKYRTGESL